MAVKMRDEKLDLLAVVACFLVVLCHECGNYAAESFITGQTYRDLFCILAEVAVPLFVMKSGVLFLNPQRQISMVQMTKKCLKLLSVIVVWGMLYNLTSNTLIYGFSLEIVFDSLKSVVIADTSFGYHLWHLYMLLGLYIIVPVLKRFTDIAPKREFLWCIAFLLAESCIIPFMCKIVGMDADTFWGTKFFGGYGDYLLYFLLGAYLYRYPLAKNTRIILASMLIVATFFCVNEVLRGSDDRIWMTYMSPFTVLYAAIAFDTLMRVDVSPQKARNRYLAQIADASFGIYIIHVMVIVVVRKVIGVDCSWASALISVPLMTVLTWSACCALVMAINRVTILKKIVLW